jgi:hypothetical protein
LQFLRQWGSFVIQELLKIVRLKMKVVMMVTLVPKVSVVVLVVVMLGMLHISSVASSVFF